MCCIAMNMQVGAGVHGVGRDDAPAGRPCVLPHVAAAGRQAWQVQDMADPEHFWSRHLSAFLHPER